MSDLLRKAASGAVWALCRLLPVQKNKIVFCSAGGRGFGDNPKAITLALLAEKADLDLVWLTRDTSTPLPKGVRPCRFGTPQAVKELSTAAVWVNDSRGGAKYKRKNQKYMQTWHGFALKHIERSAKNLPESYVNQAKKDSSQTDLIISNSDFMTDIYKKDFWYSGEVAHFGSPRNDAFFTENSCGHKVREFFSLPKDRKLVLYAPTFRDDGAADCYAIDTHGLQKALSCRFGGEWTVLLRLHPNAAALANKTFSYDGDFTVNATPYPDMQELMLASDMLITDYSSSMFDFALTGKPCIRFATDMEKYKQDRGFYIPVDQLPFPLSQNNHELVEIISSFDEKRQNAVWEDFSARYGIFEDGNASRRCAEKILQWVKG